MQQPSIISYRQTRFFLVVAVSILFLPLLAVAVRSPDYPRASASSPVSSVETIQFHSQLIGKTLPYNAILPRDYQTSPRTRYPVLYLLHGYSGHYSDWVTRTNLADYAKEYRMIVVTPEGNDGWYTDSAGTTTDKYESYILEELIPDVDRRFRTIQARYARGIAGLSMGGYGALKFGLKYPDRFVFAGSLSGATATAAWTEEDLKGMTAIRDSLFGVFGPVGSETRKRNDIYEITRGLTAARIAALPYLYLDCGTEDFLIDMNQKFAALLREKKIPHEYRELPGNHNWEYWDQQVREVLKIAAQKMRVARSERPMRSKTSNVGKNDPRNHTKITRTNSASCIFVDRLT